MIRPLLVLALLTSPALAKTDAQLRMDNNEVRQPYINQLPVVGLDATDAGVEKSARTICGVTAECLADYRQARDQLVQYSTMERAQGSGTRKAITKALQNETRDGVTNWIWAASAIRGVPSVPLRPSISVTCRSYSSKNYSRTTCS